MLKKALVGALGTLLLAGTANAVTVVAVNGPYVAPSFTVSTLYDFEDGLQPANFAGGAVIPANENTSSHAPPAGDTTNYYSVGPGDTTPLDVDLTGIDKRRISLYWGSMDGYNDLELVGLGYVINGMDVASPAAGGQGDFAQNRRVDIWLTESEAASLTGLQFRSNTNAFEFDNLAFGAVPEPATWAMMIGGFGLVGGAMRRRNRSTAVVTA